MDFKEAFDKINDAFTQFKAANDERLKQIETKGFASSDIEAKVNKINDDISALEQTIAKLQTSGLVGGQSEADKAKAEYKAAFNAHIRHGDVKAALSTGSDPDGGYTVPVELDRTILDLLRNDNPLRRLAQVITIGTPNYQKLVNKHGLATGWVGETDARPETGTNALAQLTPFMGELYANPAATQTMLDDSLFDVEAWLAAEVEAEFASAENVAFTTGNGTNKPKGILGYTTAATADATRAFGTVQNVISGAAADFITPSATASPADCLVDIIYSLKAGYRQNAVWMMNSLTTAKARKFKDAVDGQYIWQPGAAVGQPATLLGYPVVNNESMPDVGANALAAAFADFRRAYTIVDRIGTTVLRDPYSNKPYVHFYTRKRVGGMVADSNAIKLLKIAAA